MLRVSEQASFCYQNTVALQKPLRGESLHSHIIPPCLLQAFVGGCLDGGSICHSHARELSTFSEQELCCIQLWVVMPVHMVEAQPIRE